MKAAQINEYGAASVIKIVEIDQPTPVSGQVLVEVHASSINPFDTSLRSGLVKSSSSLDLPVTLGGDIAGKVTAVGPDVDGIAVDDKVYGQASVVAGNSGAFAEYAVTAATQVARMPAGLDFKSAASLPLVGVSAWQAIVTHINLQSGQKIFIHGGAGGIGSIAIQIAKHLGAYVATTATGAGIDFVKQLGVDEVIDYEQQEFSDVLSGYDAVFDAVGGDDFVKAYSVLKSGGMAVSMIAPVDENKAEKLGITALTQSTHVKTEALNALTKLVENSVITPQVDKVYPLNQIVEAFEARESGKVHGKVVLELK